MKKQSGETIRMLFQAYKEATRGRPVLMVAHSSELAEDLAAEVRLRLMMTGNRPDLVTACSRLSIPKEPPRETRIFIHPNVIEVGLAGGKERYGPRKFLLLWESFRKEPVKETADSVDAEEDKSDLPGTEETNSDAEGEKE